MTAPLDRIALWSGGFDAIPFGRAEEQIAILDEQGWGALWFGEAYGREAFTNAAWMLAATKRMTIATGIANIYARDAVAMNAAGRGLADRFPGRFVLGLGVSHQPLVERMRGHTYGSPLANLRDYLTKMREAPFMAAGENRPPVVVAALGPKALALSRELADGAHPYLGTPAHTAQAREILGPDKILAVEQGVVLSTDRETFLRRAHTHLEIYTGLPNYRNNWLRLGYDESDLGRGGSDRLADGIVAHGDEAAIAAVVQAHRDAGADQVCLQVLGESATDFPGEDIARLAAALL